MMNFEEPFRRNSQHNIQCGEFDFISSFQESHGIHRIDLYICHNFTIH